MFIDDENDNDPSFAEIMLAFYIGRHILDDDEDEKQIETSRTTNRNNSGPSNDITFTGVLDGLCELAIILLVFMSIFGHKTAQCLLEILLLILVLGNIKFVIDLTCSFLVGIVKFVLEYGFSLMFAFVVGTTCTVIIYIISGYRTTIGVCFFATISYIASYLAGLYFVYPTIADYIKNKYNKIISTPK